MWEKVSDRFEKNSSDMLTKGPSICDTYPDIDGVEVRAIVVRAPITSRTVVGHLPKLDLPCMNWVYGDVHVIIHQLSPYPLSHQQGISTSAQTLSSMSSSHFVHLGSREPLNMVEAAGIESSLGYQLLAGLVKFVHPLVATATRSLSEHVQDTTSFTYMGGPNGVKDLCLSAEGQQVLIALDNFVGLMARTQPKGFEPTERASERDSTKEDVIPTTEDSEDEAMSSDEFQLMARMMLLYAPQKSEYDRFQSEMTKAVREHVFNEMPIRMILLNKDATQLRLVERNEIAEIIFSEIIKEYPNGFYGARARDISNPGRLIQRFSKYAILSHTWIRGSPGDILYRDWSTRELAVNSLGYSKIANFCQISTREHEVQFGWMDTACINKDSSSELDESIRSMYKWYKSAHICVVYLSETRRLRDMHKDTWFTRGWTLQELLAPMGRIKFYNDLWKLLVEDKSEELPGRTLSGLPQIQQQISLATSIDVDELGSPTLIPIYRIMQLASRRNVTREEDRVYSLMGLLEISIHTAYGEGLDRAFSRLIREIMVARRSFVDLFNHRNPTSIIPKNVHDYKEVSRIVNKFIHPKEPLLMSHLGIHCTVLAIPAFREDLFKGSVPLSLIADTVTVNMRLWKEEEKKIIPVEVKYIVLDSSSESVGWCLNIEVPHTPLALFGGWKEDSIPPVFYLAILASDIDHDRNVYRLFPGRQLCIPLLTSASLNFDAAPGKVAGTTGWKVQPIKPLDPRSSTSFGPIIVNLPEFNFNGYTGLSTLTRSDMRVYNIEIYSGTLY